MLAKRLIESFTTFWGCGPVLTVGWRYNPTSFFFSLYLPGQTLDQSLHLPSFCRARELLSENLLQLLDNEYSSSYFQARVSKIDNGENFTHLFWKNLNICAIIYSNKTHSSCFAKILAWIRQISQMGWFFALILEHKKYFTQSTLVTFVTNSTSCFKRV